MSTQLPAISTSDELVLTNTGTAIQDSLVWWVQQYWERKVDGRAAGTISAKKDDLQLFFDFFGAVVRSDLVDLWTPSTSLNFQNWLLEEDPDPPRNHNRAYAPTSVNRKLATLRHFAAFIKENRGTPFAGGYPMDDVSDLTVQAPEWNGLNKLQLMRVQAALDQVLHLSTRENQLPHLKRSCFTLGLTTGLRASEIESLDLHQYHDNYLHKVHSKGKNFRKVYVPASARRDLDTYIESERGSRPGPLYQTKTGGRFRRQYIDAFLKRVASHANVTLPADEQIRLHAHKLRHTSIKRVHDKQGPVAAKKHGGHQSFKQLERYATPTPDEVEAAADKLFP